MDHCAHANELDAGHPWADTVQRHHADSASGADARPGGSLPEHGGRSRRELLPRDRARGGRLHRLGGLATGAAKRAAFQHTAPLTASSISAAALAAAAFAAAALAAATVAAASDAAAAIAATAISFAAATIASATITTTSDATAPSATATVAAAAIAAAACTAVVHVS